MKFSIMNKYHTMHGVNLILKSYNNVFHTSASELNY